MVYADFFMLQRLVNICSTYLKPFISDQTVLKILLIARAHNAEQLEQYCFYYIGQNEKKILKSQQWKQISDISQENLTKYFTEQIEKETHETYVQRCINSH